MKQNLLLLILSFIFTQQIQAQVTTGDLIGIGASLFGNKKAKKEQIKLERQRFIKDSLAHVKDIAEKRANFLKDSLTIIAETNKDNEKIALEKKLAEEREYIWDFRHYKENPKAITFNKIVVGYFDEGDSEGTSMNIYSDSTTTKKIGYVVLSQIPSTEIFDILAYNNYTQRYMIKSRKDNKICRIHESIMYYQNFSKGNDKTLTTAYTDPQIVMQEKLLLSNYRLKLNNAVATVNKLEAINNKHLVNMVNMYGVVVEQKYDRDKFTAQEKVTYKQLVIKLQKQKDELSADRDKKIGYKKTLESLMESPDWNKNYRIEHALTDYGYYALNW